MTHLRTIKLNAMRGMQRPLIHQKAFKVYNHVVQLKQKIRMAFVLVFRHFIIILTFFFFRDFEDDTEVIDSIFYYISELKQRG